MMNLVVMTIIVNAIIGKLFHMVHLNFRLRQYLILSFIHTNSDLHYCEQFFHISNLLLCSIKMD